MDIFCKGTYETSKVGKLSGRREGEGGSPMSMNGRQGKMLWEMLDQGHCYDRV